MNEDTINLLKECNSGCKSATSSMEQVLSYVRNEKLSALIKKYDEKHIKAGDECHELLNRMNEDEKAISLTKKLIKIEQDFMEELLQFL